MEDSVLRRSAPKERSATRIGLLAARATVGGCVLLFVCLAALRVRSARRADEINVLRYRIDTGFETTGMWFGSFRGEVCAGLAEVRRRDPPHPTRPPGVWHLRFVHNARIPRASTSLACFWPAGRSHGVCGFAWQWDHSTERFPDGGYEAIGVTTIHRPGEIPPGSSIVVDESSRRLVVPVWSLMLVLAGPPLLYCRHWWRRRSRQRRGLCVRCGYDLRFSPRLCPECGLDRNTGQRSPV
jgi:hypothetical protein